MGRSDGCEGLGAFSTLVWYSFLSLAHFTNNQQLKIFLAVDMNLLSRFVVRFEVNFYNSKDSCEGSG